MVDLTSSLSIDVSDWDSAIKEANDVVSKFTAQSEQMFEQVSQATQKAGSSATKYAEDVKQSQTSSAQATKTSGVMMASNLLVWAKPAALGLGLLGMFDKKFKAYAFGVGIVAAANSVFRASMAASAAASNAAHRAMSAPAAKSVSDTGKSSAAAIKLPSIDTGDIKKQIGSITDLANVIGQQALFATILYKAGLDEVGQASAKHLALDSKMMKSLGGVASSFSSIVTTGIDMFSEGLKGSMLSVIKFSTGFDSLTDIVDYGAGKITDFAKTAQGGLDYVKNSARDAGLVFGTALAIFQSGGSIDAAQFYAEGQALNEMAEATKRVTESQNIMKDALATVNGTVKNAENERQLVLDKARISTISSTEAIDKEIQALREKTVTTDKSILKTKEWKKYTEQLVGALEAQRNALLTGQIKDEAKTDDKPSEAAKQYEQLTESLNRATYGTEQSARMAIAASNATDEEVAALLALHDAVTQAENAKKKRDKDDQLFKQGAEKISDMKDQIDKLTGAATHAEVEMRKMARAGYSQEQIDEVGKLQAELDELQKKEKKGGHEKDNDANEAGSSKAAELVLRGVGAPAKTEETKVQNEQLATQKAMLEAIKGTGPKKSPTYTPTGSI